MAASAAQLIPSEGTGEVAAGAARGDMGMNKLSLTVASLSVIAGLLLLLLRQRSQEKSTCECSCTDLLSKRPSTSSPALWDAEVAPGEGVPATIQRRSSLSPAEWLNDFYRYGRPVIVTDATAGWPLFDVYSDDWVERHWGMYSRDVPRTFDVSADGKVVTKSNRVDKVRYEATFSEARAKASRRKVAVGGEVGDSSKFDFTNVYMTLDDVSTSPFEGMFTLPYFLPYADQTPSNSFPFAYFGGPGVGLPRHQDFDSCLVAWQAQISGVKQWRLQTPLTAAQLSDFPDEAFQDADQQLLPVLEEGGTTGGTGIGRPLIYDFETKPGEVLVFHVQMYHNTSVSLDRSFALRGQISSTDIKAWADWNGDKPTRNYFWESFWTHATCHENKFGGASYNVCCVEWLEARTNYYTVRLLYFVKMLFG